VSVRDYLTAVNWFAWTSLTAGFVCCAMALIIVLMDESKNVERYRNNWFVTGTAFLFLGMVIVATIGTLGLQATQ
jgi:uncharacterized membrane protein